ncbi:MAG TPA: cytidine deaminase [Anaerolineaceae bacterium]|jgi:cytidine deaminase|nr:cytidine deaminase [Anaerolineaceae bacterium]
METLTSEYRKILIDTARQYLKNSYSPYSNYPVGAAVLAEDGLVYGGTNIENSAHPSGLCAERVAINKAISEGNRRILAVAVVTRNAGAPCGACRQVMREFASLDMPVILTKDEDGFEEEFTLGELLPRSFGPDDLDRK